jgi:hypothetical protein
MRLFSHFGLEKRIDAAYDRMTLRLWRFNNPALHA